MLKFDVECCENGEAAIELMENDGNSPFDLVVLDWHLPNVDGIDIAQRINNSPCIDHLPKMIIVAAYGHDVWKHDIEALSLADKLAKPVTPHSLRDAVEVLYGLKPKLALSPIGHDST